MTMKPYSFFNQFKKNNLRVPKSKLKITALVLALCGMYSCKSVKGHEGTPQKEESVKLETIDKNTQTFESSLKQAQEENKKLILIFSGSDWCKPCILLKRTILDTDEFRDYAKDSLVVINLDFPYKKENQLPKEQKEQNDKLAEIYNPNGAFPRVLVIDYSRQIKGEVRYGKFMKPKEFIESLKSIR